jgi:chromosome segregation ATPase
MLTPRMTLAQLKKHLDKRFTRVERTLRTHGRQLKALEQKAAENERLWEQNERRWEQNERRWTENDQRWARCERRFETIEEHLRSIRKTVNVLHTHHERILDEHEGRITDLESQTRRRPS